MTMHKSLITAIAAVLTATSIYGFAVSNESRTEAITAATQVAQKLDTTVMPTTPYVGISFDFARTNQKDSDQFAIWVENDQGKLIKQLFVTNFATTTEGKQDLNTLPIWAGKVRNQTPQQIIDATAGATPQNGKIQYYWDLTNMKGQPVADGTYDIYMAATESKASQLNWKGTVTVKNGHAIITAQPKAMKKQASSAMISNLSFNAQ